MRLRAAERRARELAAENARFAVEMKEALEQQTAASEILRVISSSPTSAIPVFEAIANAGTRLLDGARVGVAVVRDGVLQYGAEAGLNVTPETRDMMRQVMPLPVTREYIAGCAILDKEVVHIADVLAAKSTPAAVKELARRFDYRSMIMAPMVRGDEAIGVVGVWAPKPNAFGDKQVRLVRTFAEQAVIAIENVRLFNETKEALEQQTAVSEVLSVISDSPTDVKPVLDAVAARAAKICDATDSRIFLVENDRLRHAAGFGDVPVSVDAFPLNRGSATGRAVIDRSPIHVRDMWAESREEYPLAREIARQAGWRTILAVPLMREERALGAIGLRRREVRPFTEKQISLLKTFADQAAIALENVRLFNETKEALKRQTATAEILRVISSTPTDTQPVFDAIVQSGLRVFAGTGVGIALVQGNRVRIVSAGGNLGAMATKVDMPLSNESTTGTAIVERCVVNTKDTEALDAPPYARDNGRALGFRSIAAAPMLREGVAIGAIGVTLQHPGGLSDTHLELLKTFSDQAVIAIENVRLFNETKEALEQQTATSEILSVISSSPSDTGPVMRAVVARAARVAEADHALIGQAEGESIRWLAAYGCPLPDGSAPITRALPSGRAFLDRQTTQVEDVAHGEIDFPRVAKAYRELGVRTIIATPLVREGKSIGVLALRRTQVRPFSKEQVALLKTFADQAAIAIENVRLFNETKEALERQTATAEILRVISGTPTDTQPVFDAIVQSALRVFNVIHVSIALVEGDCMRGTAFGGNPDPRGQFLVPLNRDSTAGTAMLDRKMVSVADTEGPDALPFARDSGRVVGFRAIATAPMLREGTPIGSISVMRKDPGSWSDKHLELLRTFADQAVIAIENARLFNETKESLEQQTATSEILGVISSSPTDLGPVFDAILKSATRLCEAHLGLLSLYDGERYRTVAQRGANPEFAKWVFERGAFKPDPDGGIALMTAERRPVQIADVKDGPAYRAGKPNSVKLVELGGGRTFLAVPLLKEGAVVGLIAIYRPAVRPFTGKQIALVSTFANQAVIAIDNVRLINETKEALEKQTATAEILRVISGSQSDLQPVFDTILDNALRLCEANNGQVYLYDGKAYDLVDFRGADAQTSEPWRRVANPGPHTGLGRILTERQPVHIPDLLEDVATRERDPMRMRTIEALGARTFLAVPLLKDQTVVGALVIYRREVRPFSDKQIALIKTFGDQAVIAIENVRLFNETKEALEQQTATAEILKVISSSPTDVQPVFNAIVQSAARLFAPCKAVIVMREGDRLHWKARAEAQQSPADLDQLAKLYPLPLDPQRSVSAQAILERRMIYIPDTEAPGVSEAARLIGRAAKHRSVTVVPLLREGDGIGTIGIQHPEAGFKLTEKQLALLRTFADQAVIAIENVRLFNETKEALERQTATSEVLKVISQTRIDLEPVLDIVLRNARKLCGVDRAMIFQADTDGNYVPTAVQVDGSAEEVLDFYRRHPLKPDRGTAIGRALLERRTVHLPDALADPEYRTQHATALNFRSLLAVPMLREGMPIGVLTAARLGEARPFTEKQLELVTTFADQAVIAIENVRLFNETTEALEQLKASAEILRVISSSVADTKPVFDAILESCQRLFEGRNVGINLVGDDGKIYIGAYQGRNQAELEQHFPVPLSMEAGSGAAILQRTVVHYPDIEGGKDVPDYARRGSMITGNKSVIFAPMLWEDRAIGAIFVGREVVGPFSEKEIGLLKTFADQAVIAIQNARLFREIHEKSQQLEIANRHKSEFLANMSHELRTPLNAIIGFTRIVMRRSKEQLDAKQYENLEKIHSSGQHLLQLINAILDLSKVEAGRVEVNAADVALGTVLEQCAKTVEPLVKAPAVRLLKEFDGELPQVYQDEEKLRQIVINLLSNAVKFTERGTVRVQAKANGESFAVAVEDTGIGIAADKLEHVFDEFAQADASSTRVYGGTGLGLTIARRLARLMGGDISVQSAPGSGSTFTLTLPVRYQATRQ